MKRLITLVLTLASASLVHATPILSNARIGKTPYDPYMAPVESVLQRLNGKTPNFEKVSALMRQAYAFRYVFDTPYVATLPHVTEARGAGDCKAKSLWLAKEMNDPNVRYVIGKARSDSKISHAWLMWNYKGQWWVLDPTNVSVPIPASKTGRHEYLVHYSYNQLGSYRHSPVPSRRSVAGHEARR